ncbi:MAG: transposase [Chloroflexi bacterium]|nr:transposase [Chloroflexota bacterium]
MSGEDAAQPKDWREARRLRAWELKQKGWKQRDIARALGVSDGAISQWIKEARKNGHAALLARRGGGPKKRLNDQQREKLCQLLELGPQHFGYKDGVWTYSRVAVLIHKEFNVTYTPTHVGRILKALGWNQRNTATPPAVDPNVDQSSLGQVIL